MTVGRNYIKKFMNKEVHNLNKAFRVNTKLSSSAHYAVRRDTLGIYLSINCLIIIY